MNSTLDRAKVRSSRRIRIIASEVCRRPRGAASTERYTGQSVARAHTVFEAPP